MVRGKRKKSKGTPFYLNQNPKENPNLPKTEQCASERYGQEEGESLVPAYAAGSRVRGSRGQCFTFEVAVKSAEGSGSPTL